MNCFFCQGNIYKKYKKRDLIKKTPFSHVYLSNSLDNFDSKCIIKIQNRYCQKKTFNRYRQQFRTREI